MQVGRPVTGAGTPSRESHMARHKQASVDEMKKPLPVLARLQHYACDSRAAKPVSFDGLNVPPGALVSSKKWDELIC